MSATYVVVHQIFHHFHASFVHFVDEFFIQFVGAVTGVYAVIFGIGITVIRSFWLIVG